MKIEYPRRFCTFNVTVRAINEQNQKLMIVYRGKPSSHDARIPASPILQKELPLYDDRVVVVWDPKTYMNVPQFEMWYDMWKNSSYDADTEYRLMHADG